MMRRLEGGGRTTGGRGPQDSVRNVVLFNCLLTSRCQLALPPATLSFHLAHLARVGLVDSQRESRFIRYRVNFDAMDDLIAFLTDNCCQGGSSCLRKTAAVSTQALRRKKARSA